nr:retrovirus-related Pol polyprotein from transposon TNT 1-94 [Tanacetum cinerariifolium]
VPQDYDVSSATPCLFIHVIYAISLSLYPFTERHAQPYFLFMSYTTEGRYNTNHSTSDCYRILYYMKCKKEDHRTSDHEMYITLLKSSQNYKAQPYQYASPSKQILKSKSNPYPPCTYCGFNNHRLDDCRNYHECEICRSYDHFTSGSNCVIQVFRNKKDNMELSLRTKQDWLHKKLKEEVYVKRPPGFESSELPNYVSKLDKAFYGLKQAPKACSSMKTPMVPSNNLRLNLAGKPISQSKRITPNSYEKNLRVYKREFWCTAIAYDPNPPADDSMVRPLKEYKIRHLCVSSLTKAVKAKLAKIIENPILMDRTPVLKTGFLVTWKILFTFVIQVLVENYSSTKQINSIQQMTVSPH